MMRAAHAVGLRATTTIMFGHVDGPANWARHLMVLRDVQAETGGFTEFVPLPFVHMGAPLFLQGRSRRGPTFAETVKMHAVGRIALHGYIDNVQVSWVKLGEEGAKVCLQCRLQRPRRHAHEREHLTGGRRQPRPGDGARRNWSA